MKYIYYYRCLNASTITKTSSVARSITSATTRSAQGSKAKSLFTVAKTKPNTGGIASSNASTMPNNYNVKGTIYFRSPLIMSLFIVN